MAEVLPPRIPTMQEVLLPTLRELGIELLTPAPPPRERLRNLDETIAAISSLLRNHDHWHVVSEVVCRNHPAEVRYTTQRRLATLADLRLAMLRLGYPLRMVQRFDR